MKKIKKIILLLCLALSSYASNIELTLRDFANLVALQNKINILVSEKIEDDKSIFFVTNEKENIYLPAFKKILFFKGYSLQKEGNFYFIDELKKEDIKTFSYTFKNLVNEDLKDFFTLKKIDYYFNPSSNTVFFNSSKNQSEIILADLNSIDKSLEQIKFKINILSTNLDNLKDRGFNLSAYKQSVQSEDDTSSVPYTYFLNLITMPYSANTNVIENSKSGLYATIKYLNQNGFTDIKNSPVLTAKSFSKVSFSSVQTLPYLISEVKNSNTTTQTTQNISYKDVGLKINISPKVLGEDIYFDLGLTIEEVLTNSALTPTTEKKELTSSYKLKRGQVLVLSGVNKEALLKTDYGIPLLKDIFLLGEFFKFSSQTKTTSTLTITIEVL